MSLSLSTKISPLARGTENTIQRYASFPINRIEGNDFATRITKLQEMDKKHAAKEYWEDKALAVAKCAGAAFLVLGSAALGVLSTLLLLPVFAVSGIYPMALLPFYIFAGTAASCALFKKAVVDAAEVFKYSASSKVEEELQDCAAYKPGNAIGQLEAIENLLENKQASLNRAHAYILAESEACRKLGSTYPYRLDHYPKEIRRLQSAISDLQRLKANLETLNSRP